MTIKSLGLLLFVILFALPSKAQKNDSIVYKVFVEADSKELEGALYYDEAVQNLKFELRRMISTNDGPILQPPTYMYYSEELCKCWVAKIKKKVNYQFRYYHPGFKPEIAYINSGIASEKRVFLEPADSTMDSLYAVDPVTGIFGGYPYVPGAKPLTETIEVYFATGVEMPVPSENKALLEGDALGALAEEGINVRQVTQMAYAKNGFYVTLGLPDRRDIDFFMYFRKHGGAIPPRGHYIGRDIFKAMKVLMEIENVESVNPTFFDKRDRDNPVDELPRMGSLQSYYYYHKNKKHYDGIETTRKFKRKLGDVHYDYEDLLENR